MMNLMPAGPRDHGDRDGCYIKTWLLYFDKCKKHSLSHQLTAQLHVENSKNKKMVIKLLQQSTFRRYAAIVLSPFFYFCCFRRVIVPLTGVINYVFCIYQNITTMF